MEKPTIPIHRIQTGWVRVHPQHLTGSKLNRALWILTSKEWTEWLPINTYLIEHPKGLVLFDTGEDPAVNAPDFYPRWAPQYRKMCQFDIQQSDSVTEGIRRLGFSLEDIRYVILSHLHTDHIGGIIRMPKTEFVISDREWVDGHRFGATLFRGYQKKRFNLAQSRYSIIHYSETELAGPFQKGYDLFNDGLLILVPTPGHTFGHQSLLVNGRHPVCLAGDAIYTQRHLRQVVYDGVADSKKAALETVSRLKEWSNHHENCPVLSAHDPEAESLLLHRNGMI